MSARIAKAVCRGLRGFGIARPAAGTPDAAPTPPLMDDAMEALLHRQGGEAAAFRCPIDQCTHFIGFGFSASGWHPFVTTLLEYRAGHVSTYDRSLLRDYYATWQPRSAAEALAGFDVSGALTELPSYCFYLTPWTASTPATIAESLAYWTRVENAEHGEPDLDYREHGIGYFGPTHTAKGEMEFRRLTSIYDRLAATGYDRRYGDVNVRVMKRGDELRFIVDGGGYHRTAAFAAAGESVVPATFVEPWVVAEEDVEYWPQVRRGVWSRGDAVRYFHHLFDFDSREWARERGLLLEQKQPSSVPGH
jgi:hypothetical protein